MRTLTPIVSAGVAATAIASILGIPSIAVAQQVALATSSAAAPSTAGESPAALQARIRELEAEVRALKKSAARKPVEPKVASLTTPPVSTPPYVSAGVAPAYASAARMPLPVRAFDWSGPYAGLSLGVGFLNADASTTGTSTSVDSSLPSPPGLTTTDTTSAFASGKARFEPGALADLYLGYNFRFAPNWVTGVQLEGSLGRFFARFDETGSSNTRDVRSDVGLTNVSSSTFTLKDSLNINFMVSALARLGYLVTPRDYIYGLAGWSYAGFNTTMPSGIDPAFGANGVTVGAGWERQVLDGWTLKLEYRYSQFETVTVPTSFANSQTQFSQPGGLPVSSSSQASNEAARISPSLQVVRVGLTHYFGDDWKIPAATAGIYKAPPPVYAWTGFYGGFSLGAGGTKTNSSTVTSSTSVATQTVPPAGIFDERFDNSSAAGDGRFRPGGLADLFLGYNRQMGSWVAGVQAEGTLARFNERLDRVESGTSRNLSVPAFGQPLSLNSISSFTDRTDDTLTMNWMLSALGRVGYLVDPRNMIYGLGGWSFASFSTSIESDDGNRTFTANGPAVGVGWERQIADAWSFRAEYRYTRFLDRTLSTSNTFNSANANLFGGGSNAFTSSPSSSTTISSDMHAFRLGFAHTINPL